MSRYLRRRRGYCVWLKVASDGGERIFFHHCRFLSRRVQWLLVSARTCLRCVRGKIYIMTGLVVPNRLSFGDAAASGAALWRKKACGFGIFT